MYEAFYHLSRKPFNLTPDSRFLFRSRSHKRALAFLRYGILKREGVIVVTGNPGTGKTTLIRALLDEIADNKNLIIANLAMTRADANELLPMVAAAFGTNFEGLSKAAVLKHLTQFFSDEVSRGKQPIFIIDEVQNLSLQALEAVRLLVSNQSGNSSILQGFLVGQSIFARMLAESETLEPLRQRVVASCHLNPLDIDETRQYIAHRLAIVGGEGGLIFTEESQKAIHEYTGGVPRRINTLCDRALLLGYLNDTHEISANIINEITQELENELFRSGREGQTTAYTTLGLGETKGVSTPNRNLTNTEISSIQEKLSSLDSRLEVVEKLLASMKAAELSPPEPWEEEIRQLRSLLVQAEADKERMERELAKQETQAKQIQKALEKEIEYLRLWIFPQKK